MDLFEPLKAVIDRIPDSGALTCVLAAVGLHSSALAQLQRLALSGKMQLQSYQTAAEISLAFQQAAEDILVLSGSYVARS